MADFTKDEVLEIVNTIREQIRMTTPTNVFWSWGVSKLFATMYNNMPTLALRVSGLLHKGWVYVSYDCGTDTYTVTLLSVQKKVKKTITEVYFDELGEIIDTNIERGTMSDKQYHKRAMADSAKKW